MKTLLNLSDCESILTRIDTISTDDKAVWGKMTVNEMVCHLADPFRAALNEITIKDNSSFITRTIAIKLVLLGMPAPKGKVKTFPEIDFAEGGGTPPTDINADKAALKELIKRLTEADESYVFQKHGIFGTMNKKQWCRLMYIHTNHHLTQFGR